MIFFPTYLHYYNKYITTMKCWLLARVKCYWVIVFGLHDKFLSIFIFYCYFLGLLKIIWKLEIILWFFSYHCCCRKLLAFGIIIKIVLENSLTLIFTCLQIIFMYFKQVFWDFKAILKSFLGGKVGWWLNILFHDCPLYILIKWVENTMSLT